MVGAGYKSDDEYSELSEKNDIGFIDFANSKNVCSYSPDDESDVVSISVPFPMVKGKPQSGLVGETIVDTITIQNKTDEPLELWYVRIYDAKPEGSFTLSLMQPPTATSSEVEVQQFMESFDVEDRVLQPNRALTLWLSCKPKGIGLHNSAVHVSVGDDIIERLVFVMAEDKISRSLASTKPFNYVRKKKQPIVNVSTAEPIVVGSRPISATNRGAKHGCSVYPVPVEIRQMIEQQQIPDVIQCDLTMQNYVPFFHTLLALEEIKMEEDMREYDLERITLKKGGHQFLWLEVPGLAEKRPSLVQGDFIIAILSSEYPTENNPSYQDKKFQGYIHHVQAEEVALKFRDDFHQNHRPENLYNVQFTYNRIGIRRLYQAIEAAQELPGELLFPSLSKRKRNMRPAQLSPISRTLNQEQVSAVKMILGCRGGSPYVIHGPPGTGKTMTLIEAIMQLYTGQKRSRVLVCAPSNSAADHILEKIISQEAVNVESRDILRLNAFSRSPDDVDLKYLEFCCIDDNDQFTCPPLRELKQCRIIISTYTNTWQLHNEGIRKGHFSHIFLDEAGQASEPETMISLSHLYNWNTVVTLAGDPQQLGPLIFSKMSEDFGLGKSYLERLFEDPFYADGNRNYMTRLVRNYRSHEKILDLPSRLFYGGELVACRKEDEGVSAPFLEILPNRDFPLLFFGLQGCDEREGNNPSWFNRIEVSKVVEIIIDLIDTKGLCEDDIGVITPYRQQVQKIRRGLEMFGKLNVQVGSVEQFQGQEKKVIVVSTVRSTIKHNEFDKIHYLGFLSNPRRFNVAITRAKSLLVLVGNPHIICKDEYWNELLWYCSDNESYQGCFLPDKEEETVEECSAPAPYSGYEGENVDPSYSSWDDKDPPASHADNDGESLKWGQAHNEDYKGKFVEPGYDSWADTESSAHTANYEGEKVEPGYNSLEVPEPVYDESEWSDGWK